IMHRHIRPKSPLKASNKLLKGTLTRANPYPRPNNGNSTSSSSSSSTAVKAEPGRGRRQFIEDLFIIRSRLSYSATIHLSTLSLSWDPVSSSSASSSKTLAAEPTSSSSNNNNNNNNNKPTHFIFSLERGTEEGEALLRLKLSQNGSLDENCATPHFPTVHIQLMDLGDYPRHEGGLVFVDEDNLPEQVIQDRNVADEIQKVNVQGRKLEEIVKEVVSILSIRFGIPDVDWHLAVELLQKADNEFEKVDLSDDEDYVSIDRISVMMETVGLGDEGDNGNGEDMESPNDSEIEEDHGDDDEGDAMEEEDENQDEIDNDNDNAFFIEPTYSSMHHDLDEVMMDMGYTALRIPDINTYAVYACIRIPIQDLINRGLLTIQKCNVWNISPTQHLLFIIKFPDHQYVDTHVLMEQNIILNQLEYRIMISREGAGPDVIDLNDALIAFSFLNAVDEDLNDGDCDVQVAVGARWVPFVLSRILQDLFGSYFRNLLAVRIFQSQSWGEAEREVILDQDVISWKEPPSVKPLDSTTATNFLKSATQYLLRRICLATRHCIVCHCRLPCNDSDPLRLIACKMDQCWETSFKICSKVEDDILSHPSAVDVLISLHSLRDPNVTKFGFEELGLATQNEFRSVRAIDSTELEVKEDHWKIPSVKAMRGYLLDSKEQAAKSGVVSNTIPSLRPLLDGVDPNLYKTLSNIIYCGGRLILVSGDDHLFENIPTGNTTSDTTTSPVPRLHQGYHGSFPGHWYDLVSQSTQENSKTTFVFVEPNSVLSVLRLSSSRLVKWSRSEFNGVYFHCIGVYEFLERPEMEEQHGLKFVVGDPGLVRLKYLLVYDVQGGVYEDDRSDVGSEGEKEGYAVKEEVVVGDAVAVTNLHVGKVRDDTMTLGLRRFVDDVMNVKVRIYEPHVGYDGGSTSYSNQRDYVSIDMGDARGTQVTQEDHQGGGEDDDDDEFVEIEPLGAMALDDNTNRVKNENVDENDAIVGGGDRKVMSLSEYYRWYGKRMGLDMKDDEAGSEGSGSSTSTRSNAGGVGSTSNSGDKVDGMVDVESLEDQGQGEGDTNETRTTNLRRRLVYSSPSG
ncbi:hypothetical protein HDU76_012740, partial [Blyttiomyces sp. JEL0837]